MNKILLWGTEQAWTEMAAIYDKARAYFQEYKFDDQLIDQLTSLIENGEFRFLESLSPREAGTIAQFVSHAVDVHGPDHQAIRERQARRKHKNKG